MKWDLYSIIYIKNDSCFFGLTNVFEGTHFLDFVFFDNLGQNGFDGREDTSGSRDYCNLLLELKNFRIENEENAATKSNAFIFGTRQ